ncbi:MAG: undecaprenyldiphospho-muramoylpentapeptide beta-N-acetylglucosaminyltransferase [Acidobacteria bacterium]|nr:undecaprenyldiphospho-muramoylpentapeptide beta-N-acetylglucosaminyltransferase [Acidobacteriota bacterium]MBU1339544.1 undecaprenyldiphospho-muramoylpentapeptide beta-N-acetylglucosaminyltransferase [Acidobacteriota bacterium]MBU1475441.1 undecaprenyldiphospho-muramoylpentapeptide beta-N-acetylglucosaminyltransferase [Acidobacteriota bacterium]MBU2438030.1 undecaprenyldiphospho-muramoylpentapeptide beta-N-acetylglucosaminyltransferase [Acidobacteriota bacterium]
MVNGSGARRIVFSGGGTAGHIHPALAVAEVLREKDPSLEIVFIGGSRTLEKTLMDFHGARFFPLPIEGLKGRGIKSVRSLAKLPFAFARSFRLLHRLKPSLSIGMGGYSSGPVMLLSSWLKIPTLIMEQNSIPGFTNRMLIPRVDKAVVSFSSTLSAFKGKGVFIGNPVRKEFYDLSSKQEGGKLTILLIGGSQGSRFLNNGMIETLPRLKRHQQDLIFFHQSGEQDLNRVREAYASHGIQNVMIKPFFFDMPALMEKADLVICRAGATTIAELIAAGKPALLIPFAGAADNHQLHNAKELEKVKGAEIITEEAFTPDLFADTIDRFLANRARLTVMSQNLSSLKRTGIAEEIADLCFALMDKRKRRM